MAYIPTKVPSLYKKSTYVKMIPSFDGGLIKSSDNELIDDNQTTNLLNMFFSDGKLSTRHGYSLFEDLTDPENPKRPEGTLHSITQNPFCGHIVFHSGTKIYKFDGISLEVICPDALDKPSICYELNSKLYFIVDFLFFEINSSFEWKYIEPYVPTICKDAKDDLTSYTSFEQINLIGNKVRVLYDAYYSKAKFELPIPANTSKAVKVVYKDQVFTGSNVAFLYPTTIMLQSGEIYGKQGEIVEVTYYIDKELYQKNLQKILGCKCCTSFGGTTNEGSRVFVGGNPDYKGHYFMSDLLDPTYFPELSFDILGNGSDDITAFAKRAGDLFVFTQSGVWRIIYSFDIDTGALFTTSEISTSIGCDMPDSVQNIDNRLVFANKTSGVYIIESTNTYDEINIKPISRNINGEYGNRNTFCDDLSLSCYPSCDFDRKYFIYTGSHLYLWDYNRSPYYESGDYFKAQKRLSWYCFSALPDVVKIFSFNGSLYFITKNECNIFKYTPNSYKDVAEKETSFVSTFSTKDFSFGYPHLVKRISYLSFEYSCSGEGQLKIHMFADSKEFFSHCISSGKDLSKKRIKLKIPATFGHTFRVEFEKDDGFMSISNLSFSFVPVTKNKIFI